MCPNFSILNLSTLDGIYFLLYTIIYGWNKKWGIGFYRKEVFSNIVCVKICRSFKISNSHSKSTGFCKIRNGIRGKNCNGGKGICTGKNRSAKAFRSHNG